MSILYKTVSTFVSAVFLLCALRRTFLTINYKFFLFYHINYVTKRSLETNIHDIKRKENKNNKKYSQAVTIAFTDGVEKRYEEW